MLGSGSPNSVFASDMNVCPRLSFSGIAPILHKSSDKPSYPKKAKNQRAPSLFVVSWTCPTPLGERGVPAQKGTHYSM